MFSAKFRTTFTPRNDVSEGILLISSTLTIGCLAFSSFFRPIVIRFSDLTREERVITGTWPVSHCSVIEISVNTGRLYQNSQQKQAFVPLSSIIMGLPRSTMLLLAWCSVLCSTICAREPSLPQRTIPFPSPLTLGGRSDRPTGSRCSPTTIASLSLFQVHSPHNRWTCEELSGVSRRQPASAVRGLSSGFLGSMPRVCEGFRTERWGPGPGFWLPAALGGKGRGLEAVRYG